MQLWQEDLIRQVGNKNYLVLIAPTGSGKTEFALMWAIQKGRKLVYTLPLRVALNDMYSRFDENRGYFNANYLSILHSTSFIEYVKVMRGVVSSGGGYDMLDVGTKQNIARQFSSPVILTTPDQVFLTSLKYYGFDKLIIIYPLCTFIIDEIQAYKPDMVAIVLKTIDVIQKLHGNVLVITATFPPYLKDFLEQRNFEIIDVKNSVVDKNKIKNYALRRHRIKVVDKSLFKEDKKAVRRVKENKKTVKEVSEEAIREIIGILNKSENADKNVLIIVNNVNKAIKLYEELEKQRSNVKGNWSLYLLHSRLLESEKRNRIDEMKKKIKNSGKRIVLISTQIVEASVDIDFDILITEASPIDSQIQRWGRVYRNRDRDYDSESPNIYIFSGIDKGTEEIYDKESVKRTIDELKERQSSVLTYEDEINLVKEVYDAKSNGESLKERYIREIKANLEDLNYTSAQKKSQAQRLFRRIAGLQVIVPSAMRRSNDATTKVFAEVFAIDVVGEGYAEFAKVFAEVFAEIIERGGDPTWDDVIKEIKKKLQGSGGGVSIDEWKLKSLLYEYSVNLPYFLFKKLDFSKVKFSLKEFKGYYYIKIKDDSKIEDLIKYGIDKIMDESAKEDTDDLDSIF